MRRMKQMLALLVAMAMLLLVGSFAEEQGNPESGALPAENLDVSADEPLPAEGEAAPEQATLTLDQTSVALDYSQRVTLTAAVSAGGESIAWSSSDENVASLSARAGESVTVMGVNAGAATITCVSGELTQTCEVTVNAPSTLQITGVDYPETLLIGRGGWRVRNGTVASTVDLATLTSVIKNAGGEMVGDLYSYAFERGVTRFDIRWIDNYIPFSRITDEGVYTWTLSATDVNGRSVSMSMPVNAIKEGEAVISSNPGAYSPILFTSGIALDNAEITLPLGVKKTLAATVVPANAIDDILIWTSDDPSVATVSPNGEVTTVGFGTATILCKALYNDKVSASCVVTVSADAVQGDGVNLLSRSLMDMAPGQIAEPSDVIRSGYGWAYAENSGPIVGQTFGGQLALEQNTEYTLSFVAWAGAEVQMNVDLYPDTLPETRIDLTPTPTRYTWTFSSDSPDMGACCLRFFKAEGFATWVNVVDVKLERGNVATDWSEPIGDNNEQNEAVVGDGVNLLSRSLMDMAPGQIAEPSDVIRSGYGWAYAENSGNIVGQTFDGQMALEQNTEYTLSFVAWAGAEVQMNVDLYPDTLPEIRVDLTPTPTRYTWTFSSDSPDMGACRLRFFRAGGFETWVNVVDVKLERGNVATDWSEPIN